MNSSKIPKNVVDKNSLLVFLVLLVIAPPLVSGQAKAAAPGPPAKSGKSAPVTKTKPVKTKTAKMNADPAAPKATTAAGPESANPRAAFTPPAGAARLPKSDGGATFTHSDGRRWEVNSGGQITRFSKPGLEARFRGDGQASSIRDDRRGIAINRSPRGERQVMSTRTGGVRVVSYGMNRGYVERPLRAGYVQRSYIVEGLQSVVVYHTFTYRGMAYQSYVPGVYYSPGFYMWASSPWAARAAFAWGWSAEPWFLQNNSYFALSPIYSGPNLWLADYVIGQNLQQSYESQQGNSVPPISSDVENGAISAPVKLAVAESLRKQVVAEQTTAEQRSSQPTTSVAEALPPVLDPSVRILVVSANLDVPLPSGGTCALTSGDIIIRTDDKIGLGDSVAVSVLSSKPGDCASNIQTSLTVAALQEMHNEFRRQMDSGLNVLAKNSGKNGYQIRRLTWSAKMPGWILENGLRRSPMLCAGFCLSQNSEKNTLGGGLVL